MGRMRGARPRVLRQRYPAAGAGIKSSGPVASCIKQQSPLHEAVNGQALAGTIDKRRGVRMYMH
jgi:hypothetical protein